MDYHLGGSSNRQSRLMLSSGNLNTSKRFEDLDIRGKIDEEFINRYTEDWTRHKDPLGNERIEHSRRDSIFSKYFNASRIKSDHGDAQFDEDGNMIIKDFEMLHQFVKDAKAERMGLEEIGGLSMLNMSLYASSAGGGFGKSRKSEYMPSKFDTKSIKFYIFF